MMIGKIKFALAFVALSTTATPIAAQTINPPFSPSGSGTVTSVGVGNIAGVTTSGGAVTTNGVVTQTLNSQTANTVFAAPNGSAGAPTFRALAPADLVAGAAIAAGNVVAWNSDSGISRINADILAVGNGTSGDISGEIAAAQFNIQGNANITQTGVGFAQLGTGSTVGYGGSLSLTGINIYGVAKWPTYPIVANNGNGVFLWATQAAGTGISPYQDIMAFGDHTVNPTTHNNGTICLNETPPYTNFCGDEVAFGAYTLSADQTGRDNTAVGDHALANLISGRQNVAIGSSAGANISTGNSITAIGTSACQNVTANTGPIECVGLSALQVAGASSEYVSAIGEQSMLAATVAQFSVGLGGATGYAATSITNSVLLGYGACANPLGLSNVICIGQQAGPASSTAISNQLWIGGTSPIIQGNLTTNALTFGGVIRLAQTTYANLGTVDAAPVAGDQLVITDASACTANTAVTAGGGSAHSCAVVYNGANWIALVTH